VLCGPSKVRQDGNFFEMNGSDIHHNGSVLRNSVTGIIKTVAAFNTMKDSSGRSFQIPLKHEGDVTTGELSHAAFLESSSRRSKFRISR